MGSVGFLFIILIFGLLWMVMVRPQKRRQQEQKRLIDQLKVGDEVLTAAGIYGEVTALRDDDVMVEIAPNVEVRLARRAIGGVVPAATEEDTEPPALAEPEDAVVEAEPHDAEVVAAPEETPR
ncbi:MAG: preprotein translocase subunit YajC [Actinobacteria bacterium]|nr:preprotein translocase subunit YajC [Actinomycetota bacterium]MBV8563312.1 preprotein translocase subunit YajC [Actinomycetota bacterium]